MPTACSRHFQITASSKIVTILRLYASFQKDLTQSTCRSPTKAYINNQRCHISSTDPSSTAFCISPGTCMLLNMTPEFGRQASYVFFSEKSVIPSACCCCLHLVALPKDKTDAATCDVSRAPTKNPYILVLRDEYKICFPLRLWSLYYARSSCLSKRHDRRDMITESW
jgi:hypothetical protein